MRNDEVRKYLSQIGRRGGKRRLETMTKAQRVEAARKAALASARSWADPEMRKRMSQAMKRIWADPERRERLSKAIKRSWADPEVRRRRRDAIKRAWADPGRRAAASVKARAKRKH